VLAKRQLAVLCGGKIVRRPLERLDFRTGRRRRGAGLGRRRGRRAYPHVALRPGVRAAGLQAFDWIDDKRQRLELDLNLLDGLGGGRFVNRRDGQDRVADIQRLVGQPALAERAGDDPFAEVGAFDDRRQVVDGEDRLHARHGHRGSCVDPHDLGVRHRAQEQLREQHPLDPVVFRVFGFAGDLGQQVGGRIVLADERVCVVLRHVHLPSACPPFTKNAKIAKSAKIIWLKYYFAVFAVSAFFRDANIRLICAVFK
jgi:hypothetical protein